MKYIIAEYKLELIGDCSSSYITSKMEGYDAEFSSPDFTINCEIVDEINFNPAEQTVVGAGKYSWDIDDCGEINAYYYSEYFKKYLTHIKWNKDFNRADIKVIDSCPLGGCRADVMIYGLIGQAFYYIMMMNHSFVFHASAISFKGNGILFSAPSGTGKSTQAYLWKKVFPDDFKFINDDTPVLKIKEGKVFAYGSPWAGKDSINNNISAPVKGIICLEQAKEIEIKKISGLDAFFRIYNETNKPVLKEMLDVMLSDLKVLLSIVDVYLMKCSITDETVYAVKDLLSL